MVESTEHHSHFRRGNGASEAFQDYAKTIYALQRRGDGGPVGTSALAERLGVSPASTTAMLKRMADEGLVDHEPYRGVTLTASGRRVALEVLRHHRLIESYLSDALGMPWDRVHDEAEVLEHYISEELEERIAEALGNPSVDPHGDPIPDAELGIARPEGVPLADLGEGASATLSRVSDADPDLLRYLADRGIRLGTELRVAERDEVGGSLLVEVDGSPHAIGERLAERMLVAELPRDG